MNQIPLAYTPALPTYMDNVFELDINTRRIVGAFINKLEKLGYDRTVLWQIWNKVAMDAAAPYDKWGDVFEMTQVTHQNVQTFVCEIEKLGAYDQAILLQTWGEATN